MNNLGPLAAYYDNVEIVTDDQENFRKQMSTYMLVSDLGNFMLSHIGNFTIISYKIGSKHILKK